MKRRRIRIPSITLNNDQAKVVHFDEGALIVTAGPGSGKTRVVVERIARMIHSGIRPESILATTFTKKAAEEMNARLEAKKIDTSRMSVQTTHSFCWRLITSQKEYKSWKFDEKNRAMIILKIILSYKNMNWNDVDNTAVETFISNCRNTLTTPEDSVKYLQGEYADQRFQMAYEQYHEWLKQERLITFDCMLYRGVRALQNTPRLLSKMQSRYRYVMVDETQDSNFAQIQLADLVAGPEYNLMVVGDEDQAIYSWRGALPGFMLEFQEKYAAHRVTLGINYRCAPCIVTAATKCIEHNEQRLEKVLVPNRDLDTTVQYHATESTDDEANVVSNEIEIINQDGVSFGNIIILMRTNAQSRAIEEAFIQRNIPFVVLGAVSFYERKEIKRLLAYLRVVCDPRDVENGELALRSPYRKTSAKLHDNLAHASAKHGGYLQGVMHAMDNGQINQYARDSVIDFISIIEDISKKGVTPSQALRLVVDSTDFVAWLEDEDGSDSLESNREQNINELISACVRFNTIPEFIKYVDKQIKLRKRNQRKKQESRVQVMSIHKSKGTESLAVFLIGANEGILPHYKGDEEEERRLFYVAMTRAKDMLHISSVGTMLENGVTTRSLPSKFIDEAGLLPLTTEDTSTTVGDSTGIMAVENTKTL